MSDTLRMTLTNELSEIHRLIEAAEAFFDSHGVGPKAAYALTLALDEVLTNVICYAYPAQGGHAVDVILQVTGGQTVQAEVWDDGAPFDPLHQAPEPDLEADLDDRPIGGLGIHLVREMMDEAYYERVSDKNRLVLRKHIEA